MASIKRFRFKPDSIWRSHLRKGETPGGLPVKGGGTLAALENYGAAPMHDPTQAKRKRRGVKVRGSRGAGDA